MPIRCACGWKTDRELATATVSLEGLESAIMDKSLSGVLGKICTLSTSQTRIQLHLPNLAAHPLNNVENYLQFHLIFSIVFEEREKVTWKAALVSNLSIKTQIVKLRKCPKDFCPRLSDQFSRFKEKCTMRMFNLALSAFRTWECKHLRLGRHF